MHNTAEDFAVDVKLLTGQKVTELQFTQVIEQVFPVSDPDSVRGDHLGQQDRPSHAPVPVRSALPGLDQARESGDMESVVMLEKRLLGFQAVYGEWIDRSAKHAELALDAGVEERKVRVAEQQGELIAQVIRSIRGDLGLNSKQQSEAPAVVRRHLLALAG